LKLSTRFSFLFALALLMLLAAGPAIAFVGTVRYEAYPGGPWNNALPYTYVKICNVAYAGAWSGQGVCLVTTTDSYGNFGFNVTSGSYATFAWNTYYGSFGSDSSAAWGQIQDYSGNWYQGTQLNLTGYTNWVNLLVVASPNQPQAIYPANESRQIPLSFTLKWTSDHTGWAVTYDIYGNGSGAQESLLLSNIPCNPDASGNCSYPITNLAPTSLFYWRVVAKLHPGWAVDPPSSIYYTTSSARFSFATQGTTYSLTTVNGYKVSADGCGGSGVSARGTSLGPCETLKIIDLNGGTLDSGDQINIQVYATPWNFTAQNGGGGALLANSQWGAGYETFNIYKTNGWGTIQNGDPVSLRSYNGNYCSAELGGGDVVNCNRVVVGAWETFTLGVLP